MAAFVRTNIVNNFINRPLDARQWLSEALAGGSDDSRKSLQHVLRQPDFIIEGTTDGNTAVLNAGAAQSYLINLTTEGLVAFPSGFDRDILIEAHTRDETGPNYQIIQQTVRGGSDPTLVNGVRNMGPLVGGRVTYATAAATAADSFGGFSITGAATATGRYAFAIPKARRALVDSLHHTIVGTGTLANLKFPSINALTLSTGVGELGLRQMSDGTNVAPADTEQTVLLFDILPVESPELAIVTSTSPDQVIVGALGQASENVNWLVNIYVGPLRPNSAATNSD
jgi:hypothetical protein